MFNIIHAHVQAVRHLILHNATLCACNGKTRCSCCSYQLVGYVHTACILAAATLAAAPFFYPYRVHVCIIQKHLLHEMSSSILYQCNNVNLFTMLFWKTAFHFSLLDPQPEVGIPRRTNSLYLRRGGCCRCRCIFLPRGILEQFCINLTGRNLNIPYNTTANETILQRQQLRIPALIHHLHIG